jgi:energy-converting hydrogenase Eha subunit C
MKAGGESMDRKYAVQGIIGCLLFGLGDWLLGFVDPGKIDGDTFYFISAGHGAEYADWEIAVALAAAVIGVLFLQQGFVHIADIMKDDRDRAGAQRVFTFMTFGWLIIHFVVAANVWGYSYACRAYGSEQAALLSAGMNKVFAPCLYLAYFIAAVALIDLVIVTARGRTILKRREAFFTPLTWIVVIGAVALLLPASPFSKGLYTFCMNGGMLVWFVRYLFVKGEDRC